MSLSQLAMSARLPPELICKIFLHAARSSSSSCNTLCKVSTWARRIALPHLYTTVSIDPRIIDRFFTSVTSLPLLPPNASFRPTDAVENLWITVGWAKFETLTQLCPNISHLAVRSYNFIWFLRADASLWERPEKDADPGPDLHILMLRDHHTHNILTYNYDPHQGNPLLPRITHLRLEDSHMPRITHYAMPCAGVDVRDLAHVLSMIQETSIKVFVLILTGRRVTEELDRIVEEWVRKAREEWDVEVRGGVTIWERAFEYTQLVMSRI
ncbi:hypothetical protein BD779DRAFT_1532861 [Infundibulicybe gibba]|nr:hypothetical protein BD779DRAFT_1532861 [Infundibulicybe gibba]